MIFGTGTDIFEISRMKKALERDEEFASILFTGNEALYCAKTSQPEQHFAARFSAKEAFLKALGTGLRDGIKFADIEIMNDSMGKPCIRLFGKAKQIVADLNIVRTHLAMSIAGNLALAMVILEK